MEETLNWHLNQHYKRDNVVFTFQGSPFLWRL